MKAYVNNNTASFDAENAESVQKSGNICLVGAILAYVINQILIEVHYRVVRDRLKNVSRSYENFIARTSD